MPAVFRTQNPLQYTELEGVIVTELSPPPALVSAGSNNTVLVAQFEKGPEKESRFVSSVSELQSIFGDNLAYGGNKVLRLKKFNNLYVIRVVAAAAAKANWTQTSGVNQLATFTAKYKGKYGNSIKVTIADGSTSGTKKVSFSLGTVLESFDNVETAGKTNSELKEIFRSSSLVDVTGAHATEDIVNVASQALATGTDGVVAPTDYTNALNDAGSIPVSGKVYVSDLQTAAVQAVMANFVKTSQDGQCVIGPSSLDTSVTDAIAEFAILKDNKGRVLYVYNPPLFNVEGDIEAESPAYLAASILSLTPPHVSPAAARTVDYTQTAVGTKFNLSRANLISLRKAGIMQFEDDSSLGVKIVSGVTGNPEFSVLRRRMSDFYINSVANYLKNYQDEPNSVVLRSSIKSAIQAFDETLVRARVLPGDEEVTSGKAFYVETEGITSDHEKAMGILKIILRRRLFPAASFLVLVATISESVLIEEQS